jgi:predicted nuclease of restriction endonuclease-like (RecB) superfamily
MAHNGSTIGAVASTEAYQELLDRLMERIRESQRRATRALSTELVTLYWSIGREIIERQQAYGWGEDVVGQIAQDLTAHTGRARGFSRRNLFYMRRFAALWPELEKVQTPSAQIGWSHHQVLMDACGDDQGLYAWYATKTVENRWAVRQLKAQIGLRLHERQGSAVTNFMAALESPDARHTLEAVKDPYVFEFLELTEDVRERHLEQALIDDIQRFLLELGTGFAFFGRQHALLVGGQEFFLDLLFYHHTLRRFVVIELKVGPFEAEHVSKMNLYLNAVDEQLRLGDDRESVGIILCTERNEAVAKLTLQRICAPIAVSTWQTGSGELAQLDDVRTRLVDRLARRTPQIIDDGLRDRGAKPTTLSTGSKT